LRRFWWLRGHLGEGRRWLERVLALPWPPDLAPAARADRARAHLAAGNVVALQWELHLAVQHTEIALSLSREAGDDLGVSQALHLLGHGRAYEGNHDLGRRLCEESVAIARRSADPHALAMALMESARVARFLDEYDRVVAFCEES